VARSPSWLIRSVSRARAMKPPPTSVLNVAVTHFLLSVLVAAIVFTTGYGMALSDSYQPDPGWYTFLWRVLYVLQAPVAGLAWLWHRLTSGHMNILAAAVLAAAWSLLLGYTASFGIRQLREHPK
jgi:hypothetical protein